MKRKLIPVHSRSEIPQFATDEDFAEFWDTHEVTEELLADARAHGWTPERPADRLARLRSTREKAGREAGQSADGVRDLLDTVEGLP